MGWLSFCAVAVLAVVNVRVTTLDGEAVEGVLRQVGADGLRLADREDADAQTIPLENILEVERTDSPAVSRPTIVVGLSGGSRIAVTSITAKGQTAELVVRNQGPLEVPLKQLRWIRFRPPSAAVDPQWIGLIERPRTDDALVVRRAGDSIDEVGGIVTAIGEETVTFDLDGDSMEAPIARLEGLLFAGGGPAEEARPITVDDVDGSRWSVVSLATPADAESPDNRGEMVELKLADGLSHRMPLERLLRMELTGSVKFLASATPADSGYTPYVSLGLSEGLVSRWLGPESSGRDLVMRSTSHVEFRLDPGDRTLVGSVEHAPDVSAGGHCLVRILVDGKTAWEQTLDVGEAGARGFELPLSGARRVRLEVRTAGDGDLGDTVRFRQPRIMK